MTAREMGFLLLTSHLGDVQRKVLTVPQLRLLARCVSASDIPQGDGQVAVEDIMAMGFNRPSAQRIVDLLSETERLQWYLKEGGKANTIPITRVSTQYPLILRKRLGLNSPGSLWLKGDAALLDTPMIALVGSRELRQDNRSFAETVGAQAARQGITLVSGNARGADRTAQEACLRAGGRVISVVADALTEHPERENVLYISEDGFDLPFSAQRALSRNRVIHALGQVTLVAQCTLGKGGTWNGVLNNLKYGCSPVFCFADGSQAAAELQQRGAAPVTAESLKDLAALQTDKNLFDQ